MIYSLFKSYLFLILFFSGHLAFGFGKDVERHCIKKAQPDMEKCAVYYKQANAAAVASAAPVATDADGGVDKATGLSSITEMAANNSRIIAQECMDMAVTCEQRCKESKAHHEAKARSKGDMSEQAKAEKAQDTIDQLCMAMAKAAVGELQNADTLMTAKAGTDTTKESMKGGGLLGSGMMGPLLGAGAALGAMCLMGRGICEKDDKDDGKSKDLTEAQIDCNKAENHKYQKCEAHYLNLCEANPNGTGCAEFNNHYCGMSLETNTESNSDSDSGPEKISANSGVGSTFCQYQVAVDYCKDDGTSSCPSCRQLQQAQSPVCRNSPATCLPGWTNQQLSEAKNYCPTDPMFVTTIGSSESESGETSESDETSEDSGDSTAENDGGTSEGLPSGSGGTTVGTGDGTPDTDTASLDQLGDTTATNYGTTNTTWKASNLTSMGVGNAFGPGLFADSQQVYDHRCKLGYIDNCGPRTGLGTAQ